MLNDPDAKIYGTALSNALRHFPIAATQKAIDIAALVIAAFNFDGVRLATEMQIRRHQRQAARTRPSGPAQVFQFKPFQSTPQAGGDADRPYPQAMHAASGGPPTGAAGQASSPDPTAPISGPPPDMTYEPDYGGAPA